MKHAFTHSLLASEPVTEDEVSPSGPLSIAQAYNRHSKMVMHLGLRYSSGNTAWAEDLTHDVFVKLAERPEVLDEPSLTGAWLYRVTVNLAISQLRREQNFLYSIASRLRGVVGSDESPLEQVCGTELATRAMRALATLPVKERVVLTMKLLDHKSQAEISNILDISEGYVSKLVARAIARIRKQGWVVEP